ncbi:MAG: outer membrane lipoprotein-sorting protein [Pseudomonadota bacterium]
MNNRTEQFFYRVTRRPALSLLAALIFIALCAAGMTTLVKNTSLKAFIPPGHEALANDARATELFGLSDTVAIALITTDGGSVFRPQMLSLIADITDQVENLDNVRADRVMSLASESSIRGDAHAISIDPYVDTYALDAAAAEDSYVRWRSMAPHQGTLVSDDGSGAIIMAELIDADHADITYAALRQIVAAVDPTLAAAHVAGPGAVSGYLSRYIDRDARKLVPLAFLLVLTFIYITFRRVRAMPGPLCVVIGATVGALGIMALSGVAFFAITNALPIVIVAISVADAIHVLSEFYQLRAQHPDKAHRDLVVGAMTSMARPITLTSVTTIAGFGGIALMSVMPPIIWFGVFAALGVALAWAFSLLVLPNIMMLLNPGQSPAFATWAQDRPGALSQRLADIGAFAFYHHRAVLALFAVMTCIAAYGAAQLRVDRSQVENFTQHEPIRIADELINREFAGTAFLDVIIESDAPDALLTVEAMDKIRQLQTYFESLPHVTKTVSIVDYISLLHGAVTGLPADALSSRPLPATDSAIAESLFIYQISGDPGDLDEEIDADHQHALVRGVLDAHYFSQNRVAVEALQQYLKTQFNSPGLTASLTGDVTVTYHWMQSLQQSHFNGVILSLVFVLIASMVVFRSALVGLMAVVPVLFTVLTLYACMGFLGIYLEPATSMFAAIALGVGVDFAIHLVDRLRAEVSRTPQRVDQAIRTALPSVARACFFNSAALGLGFSVLTISDLPTLTRFGGLIALAAFASYATALVIVPALFAAQQAWMQRGQPDSRRSRVAASVIVATIGISAMLHPDTALAEDPPTYDADSVARAVAERAEGTVVRRTVDMTLTNARNRVEQRIAVVHKLTDGARRATRITFVEPKKSRDISFLSHDFTAGAGVDKRWMFLPAARKTRQVPAAQRGKSFLGTDFSFEDMQSELKFDLRDWQFSYHGSSTQDGRAQHHLSGTPVDARTAKEIGYGGFTAIIDEATWIPVRIEFVDPRQKPLKTIEVDAIELIDGIWTAHDIVATNHQTQHKTELRFRNVDYAHELDERMFQAQTLARGLDASLLR